tara:strand:+ start:1579 stop:2775 length:1197 start_codon:yes stop_codon:yes gene_type:complete
MNRDLGLRLLGKVMSWDDEQSMEEFHWLTFMSAYKYDGYRDYCAGARFIESLVTWLQQFEPLDRKVAYNFVKNNLIYFSQGEIHRLVEKVFPEHVQERLIDRVASNLGIPSYLVWASLESELEYICERRKTLFMGLSDGARIDALRRMNAGVISNEQVVIATQIDHHKWESLLKDLRSDLAESRNGDTSSERFSSVYLLDDFTASGTSILPDPGVVGGLKGKLVKFLQSVNKAEEELGGDHPFSDDYRIYVHHYIGTEAAKERIECVYTKVQQRLRDEYGADNITFTYGMLLPQEIAITSKSRDPFAELCKKYYDTALEGKGKHGGQSGITNKMFGYASCGLPIVLEHNTPNNSLALLWARTQADNEEHSMRPLFCRRERHSDMEQGSILSITGDKDD